MIFTCYVMCAVENCSRKSSFGPCSSDQDEAVEGAASVAAMAGWTESIDGWRCPEHAETQEMPAENETRIVLTDHQGHLTLTCLRPYAKYELSPRPPPGPAPPAEPADVTDWVKRLEQTPPRCRSLSDILTFQAPEALLRDVAWRWAVALSANGGWRRVWAEALHVARSHAAKMMRDKEADDETDPAHDA